MYVCIIYEITTVKIYFNVFFFFITLKENFTQYVSNIHRTICTLFFCNDDYFFTATIQYYNIHFVHIYIVCYIIYIPNIIYIYICRRYIYHIIQIFHKFTDVICVYIYIYIIQ